MHVRELLAVPGRRVRVVEHQAAQPSRVLASLAEMAPWLESTQLSGQGAPRVEVAGPAPHGSIAFVGPIEGRQVEPLVLLLRELATGQPDWDTPATPQLAAGLPSARIDVYVSPNCTYCPAVASAALRLAQANPALAVTILRADLCAPPDGVRAVPAVAVNGAVVSTGAIGEYTLAERVADHVR